MGWLSKFGSRMGGRLAPTPLILLWLLGHGRNALAAFTGRSDSGFLSSGFYEARST